MPTKSPAKKAPKYIQAVGRRKQAVARVRLNPRTDTKTKGLDILVNKKPVAEYFFDPIASFRYSQPLKITNTLERYSISAKIEGSGPKSQLLALIHGIARALVKSDEELRPVLKKHGLLTRDPRKRQRRMIGKGGKSRRQKQSPKR